MSNFYPYILSLTSTLNDWNDKINKFISENGDSAFMGAAIV